MYPLLTVCRYWQKSIIWEKSKNTEIGIYIDEKVNNW